MDRIIELDIVRIVALDDPPDSHLAVEGAERPPALGDEGTVVHLVPERDPDDPNARYLVEMADDAGGCVWLAEFRRDQLRLVRRPATG